MQQKTYQFKTEVQQLLNIVIHSLYSNREIFLRELISNAADASEKLRLDNLGKNIDNPKIKIVIDKEKKQIVISDTGIGMSYDEVVENLGTIATSGTKKFINALTGNKNQDANLIGKFGVGFYSSYIVSKSVIVKSLKYGLNKDQAVLWSSNADSSFEVSTISKNNYGTDIILNIKKEHEDLLDDWKIKQIVKKYSNHIRFPIQMLKRNIDKDGKEHILDEWETINNTKALWLKNKSEINDSEYQDFYKSITNDFKNSMLWIHNKVEGKLDYINLLYIPSQAPFDLWDRERKSGLNLYIQRVFIMQSDKLIPSYLRFVKGLVDSNDLELNISREILQHNNIIEKIKKSITKKILNTLLNLSKDKNKYNIFWKEFGQVLKEGPAEDTDNIHTISELLLFASTFNKDSKQNISLKDYCSRMQVGQKNIYYITAESFNAAKDNPQLEIFKNKGIEVLLLHDRVDEWMTSQLKEYNNFKLKSITKGELELDDLSNNKKKIKMRKTKKTSSQC